MVKEMQATRQEIQAIRYQIERLNCEGWQQRPS
jgi:hypothetical protein